MYNTTQYNLAGVKELSLKKYTYYKKGEGLQQFETFSTEHEQKFKANVEHGEVFWLNVFQPTVVELQQLSDLFEIHPLTTEDIQMEGKREKCEVYKKYIFLCLNRLGEKPINTSFQKEATPAPEIFVTNSTDAVHILMFGSFVLTVLFDEKLAMLQNVIRRLEIGLGGGRLRVSGPGVAEGFLSSWIMYCVFDDIVDEFLPQARTLELELDAVEDLVAVQPSTNRKEILARFSQLKKQLTAFIRLLRPKNKILSFLAQQPSVTLQKTDVYLRDVQDHVITMLEEFESDLETLNQCHSNYFAQVSIEIAELSNEMENLGKRMNLWGSIFLLPALLTGLWGMNVPVPGQENTGLHDYGSFFFLCFSMVLSGWFMYYVANRKILF